ncbi:MAG: F0F1 ATP synthase subunit B [Flavobacteriaceae bacterium]|nr:F0F1 ATP synthase subunit B [Flavobacteriaceae bacterium]|tara:strand:+ start:293 stop:787 length:495 start_codon:yes stop_codon:yes gene_type:complete
MDLITPGFGLVFWTAITFIFLLLILGKFAWKPILGAVSEREEGIKTALASAENARKEMENLSADNDRILKEARLERQAMLKEARELKNNMIETAKSEAKDEANKLIAQAQLAIEAEKKAAIADLKSAVAKLSIKIAETVVREELADKAKQEKLVESMLKNAKLN